MITKADIVLAVLLLVLGIGSPFLLQSKSSDKSAVEITADGRDLGKYALDEDRVIVIVDGADGSFAEVYEGGLKEGFDYGEFLNLIIIENGKVCVKEASCRGGDCVKMGRISREGEIIACLPHKLLISISASSGTGADVVLK